jgi:hypothetical protein
VAGAVVALTIHDADAATTIAVRGGRGPESSGRPTVGMPSSPEGKVRE